MNFSMFLSVGLGGFFGAIARWSLSGLVQKYFGGVFPYGTLTVNVLGCLILGLIMTCIDQRNMFSPQLRLLMTTGFLGSLTTFSTFSYESYSLLKNDMAKQAFSYVALNLVLGFIGIWLGIQLAKLIPGSS